MKTLQGLGLMLTATALVLGYLLLSPVRLDSAASAAGASGLGLMFGVVFLFGLSALMLLPSSIALLAPSPDTSFYFQGSFWLWLWLWGVNLIISAGYALIVGFVAVVWIIGYFNSLQS